MQNTGKRKNYMQKALVLAAALCLAFHCAGRLFMWWNISHRLNIFLPFIATVTYADRHGGFHGDGETICTMTFGETSGERLADRLEESGRWYSFPVPERLWELIYEIPLADSFHATFAEAVGIGTPADGYWFFADRDTFGNYGRKGGPDLYGMEAVQRMEERGQERENGHFWPFNFDLAVYVPQARTLYFFAFDI